MAAAEECVEPLKYQTWVLKVSIHCEGCKKKVKKVLQSMEGVYKTTVDSQQHKVVVTGNVEAQMLIKKLLKAGKHAELWPPEKKSNNEDGASTVGNGNSSKKSKSKNGNKQSEPSESPGDKQLVPGDGGVPSDVSDKPAAEATAKKESKESLPSPEKEGEGEKTSANGGSGSKKKTKKPQKENTSNDNANNNSSNSNKNSGGGGGGGSSTKNKSGCGGAGAREIEGVQQQEATKKTVTGGGGTAVPPAYNFPVYAATQMPSYVVSYSSMQPSMSYGGAYYSALPMMQSTYVYSTSPTPASYYACNEDYSNACSVM